MTETLEQLLREKLEKQAKTREQLYWAKDYDRTQKWIPLDKVPELAKEAFKELLTQKIEDEGNYTFPETRALTELLEGTKPAIQIQSKEAKQP